MSLESWFMGIQKKVAEHSAKKTIRIFRKNGIRKAELDENMNFYITSADGISQVESLKKFKESGNEAVCAYFFESFTEEFDALCSSREEFLRDGVKVRSWTFD